MKSIGLLFFVFGLNSACADFQSHAKLFSIVNDKDISGFTITTELPDKHPLKKLGVQKGDIVIAVDSNPIYDGTTAMSAYDNKYAESVTVLRGNKQIQLRNAL